jgi:hypothetical protein
MTHIRETIRAAMNRNATTAYTPRIRDVAARLESFSTEAIGGFLTAMEEDTEVSPDLPGASQELKDASNDLYTLMEEAGE